MIQTVYPGSRTGVVNAPASKSIAHRMLICAALSEQNTRIKCRGISNDIAATIACLNAIGAKITVCEDDIFVEGISLCEDSLSSKEQGDTAKEQQEAGASWLLCQESGSTLRFLLPIVGALGLSATFLMEGRLPERPMDLYEKVLTEHGMVISREKNLLHCSGQLKPGVFSLPGNISSQYFTGLLFALPLLSEDSTLICEGCMESKDYVVMTEAALEEAGISCEEKNNTYIIQGRQRYMPPKEWEVEGDYSGAAFFLCAGAFSKNGITVNNLREDSLQGDKKILEVLKAFGAEVTRSGDSVTVKRADLKALKIDASMIPDLIPVLSVLASNAEGETLVYNGQRLRMKESDRIKSTVELLKCIGADAMETEDGLRIRGSKMHPGNVMIDPVGDHRLAMSAAIAAAICEGKLTIKDSECVKKSYIDFWKDFYSLKEEQI